MEEQDESYLGKLIYRNSNLNYHQIFNLKKNNKLKDYYNQNPLEGKNYFLIQDFNRKFFDYFFYQPITIQYSFVNDKDNNNQITINNIYSTEQIENYNKIKNVNNPHIVFKDIKIIYDQAKLDIYNYIKNNILIITNEQNDYEDNFIFDDNIIEDNKFEKKKLSEYFDNYFVYNKKEEKEFEYEQTTSRDSLISLYINIFILNQNLRFFKFCGPTSTGKSTTLLKFSREQRGIVYLNLKAIHEFYKIID